MFGKPHTEVLVVGAGPVGLFASLLLAQHQVETQLIDEEWRGGAHSYALALHPHSLDLLAGAGVLPDLLPYGRALSGMAFYDGGERKAEVSFGALGGANPYLLVVPQNVLEEVLVRHLQQRGVGVKWGASLSAFVSV